MKTFFFLLTLCSLYGARVDAQQRFSLTPTYWFQHNPYAYQVDLNFYGQQSQTQATGFNTLSSLGLMLRYQFAARWNVAIGGLYGRVTNHLQNLPTPYGESSSFTSKSVQVPLLVGYRLTSRRLSPYFSAGSLFTKSVTFTEAHITTDGVAGAGLDYRLSSGVSLLVQPTASYSFSPPANNTYYRFSNYRSYNFGLQAQLVVHL